MGTSWLFQWLRDLRYGAKPFSKICNQCGTIMEDMDNKLQAQQCLNAMVNLHDEVGIWLDAVGEECGWRYEEVKEALPHMGELEKDIGPIEMFRSQLDGAGSVILVGRSSPEGRFGQCKVGARLITPMAGRVSDSGWMIDSFVSLFEVGALQHNLVGGCNPDFVPDSQQCDEDHKEYSYTIGKPHSLRKLLNIPRVFSALTVVQPTQSRVKNGRGSRSWGFLLSIQLENFMMYLFGHANEETRAVNNSARGDHGSLGASNTDLEEMNVQTWVEMESRDRRWVSNNQVEPR
ncbi:hypothetical protein VNO78_19873 [Psophocarpus tetragonolobus]|uniref:Uncharacterized protein n=1 Tax=Psophocarpus tetragonolobus TaxID=3891 RepID=A0AAN9S8W7_PSOTE